MNALINSLGLAFMIYDYILTLCYASLILQVFWRFIIHEMVIDADF